jgi:hypothetical protein
VTAPTTTTTAAPTTTTPGGSGGATGSITTTGGTAAGGAGATGTGAAAGAGGSATSVAVVPSGFPHTGFGGAAHTRDSDLIGLGALALASSGGAFSVAVLRRRLALRGEPPQPEWS